MTYSLALRLAGPVQSWGGQSQFNRRDTLAEPTKSGIIGLLAAAQGLRRQDPIEPLLGLTLGVRIDQPGSILRDYHTVSTLDGGPLLSAQVNAKGAQKRTSPAKETHVTHRFYLQDAAFVAAVSGPTPLLATLAAALRNPAFPLTLGRRSCPPTQPLVLAAPATAPNDAEQHTADQESNDLWAGDVFTVLHQVPWQASPTRRGKRPPRLAVTLDDPAGDDVRTDVPHSFDPLRRGYATRSVRQDWVTPPGLVEPGHATQHDPFALLGW